MGCRPPLSLNRSTLAALLIEQKSKTESLSVAADIKHETWVDHPSLSPPTRNSQWTDDSLALGRMFWKDLLHVTSAWQQHEPLLWERLNITIHRCTIIGYFNNCNFSKHQQCAPWRRCDCTEICRSCSNVKKLWQFCFILYFYMKPHDVHFGPKYVAGYIDQIYSNLLHWCVRVYIKVIPTCVTVPPPVPYLCVTSLKFTARMLRNRLGENLRCFLQ